MIQTVTQIVHTAAVNITPTAPPGVGDTVNTILGYILWGVMILAIIGLLVIAFIGVQSWRHNQAQQFVDKFLWWGVGCLLATAAVPITKVFFPTLA